MASSNVSCVDASTLAAGVSVIYRCRAAPNCNASSGCHASLSAAICKKTRCMAARAGQGTLVVTVLDVHNPDNDLGLQSVRNFLKAVTRAVDCVEQIPVLRKLRFLFE